MKEQKLLVNGIYLNYVEGAANGRPLILIHGGSARWQAFENIIPELASNHHLFALDLRGHGKSGRAAGQYAGADYASDIIAFMMKLLCQLTHIKLNGISHVLHNEDKDGVLTAVLDYLNRL